MNQFMIRWRALSEDRIYFNCNDQGDEHANRCPIFRRTTIFSKFFLEHKAPSEEWTCYSNNRMNW